LSACADCGRQEQIISSPDSVDFFWVAAVSLVRGLQMTEKTQKIVRGMCVLGAAVLLSGAPVQAELQSGGTLLVPGTIMGAPVTAKAEAKSVAQVNAAKEAAKTQTSSLADLASADVLEITDAPLPADIKSETAPQIISPVAQAAKPEEAKPTEEVAAAPASSIEPAAQEVKSVVPPVALGSGTVIGNPVYAKGDAKRAKPAPVAIASAEPVTPPVVAKVEAPAPVAAPASAPAPEVAKVADVAEPVVAPAPEVAAPAAPVAKMVSVENELKRLAPAKYRLVYASNVDKSAKVPQASGKNWQESVNAVAQSAGLRIEDSNGLMFISKSMTTSADYKAAGIAPAPAAKVEAVAAAEAEVVQPAAPEVVIAKTDEPVVAPVVAAPEVALAASDDSDDEVPVTVAASEVADSASDNEPGFFGRLFADIGSWFSDDEAATPKAVADEAPVAIAQSDVSSVAEPMGESVAVEQASAPVVTETTVVAAAPVQETVAAVEPAAGVSAPASAVVAEPGVAVVPSPDMVAHAGSNFMPRSGDKPVAQETVWRAEQGQTLLQVMRAWSEKAGVQLYWDSKYDYPLQASVTLTGSYENAVRSLLQGFENAAPQPIARLHRQGNSGNKVLIIRNRGNIYGVR
jgi:hypothetical protein